jgi:hypothetical protein
LPWFREEEILETLGLVLEDVCVPRDVAEHIAITLEREHVHLGARVGQERARLVRTLSAIRTRLDAPHLDKLDGKISEEFLEPKTGRMGSRRVTAKGADRSEEQHQDQDSVLNARRILELGTLFIPCMLNRIPRNRPNYSEVCFRTAPSMP